MQRTPGWYRPAIGVVSLLLVLYTLLRAGNIPFTYDEAYSYLYYASMPPLAVMRAPAAFGLANNHVLNTLLLQMMKHAGHSPLLLRLPNVLAGGLFLYSSDRIARRLFGDYRLRLLCFLGLILNPMLYEFFALARGYGLGIGLLLFSISQLPDLKSSAPLPKAGNIHACLTAAILAAYSTFSLLPPVLLIFLLAALAAIVNRNNKMSQRLSHAIIWPFLYGSLLLWLVALPLKYLIVAKALFHGGRQDFLHDTWYSMISDLAGARPFAFEAFDAGNPPGDMFLVIALSAALLLAFALALTITQLMRKQVLDDKGFVITLWLLLAGCIAGINVQFYLQGTLLPVYRVALYLYPLSMLALFATVKTFAGRYPRTAAGIAGSWIILLTVNFLPQLQLTRTTEWPFDAYNKQAAATITSREPQPATIASYHLMEPSLQFYAQTAYEGRFSVLPVNDSLLHCCPQRYDYLYYPRHRLPAAAARFMVIAAFEDSTYLLLRRAR